MKKLLYLMIVTTILVVFLGSGCAVNGDEPNQAPGQALISGTVYSIEDGRILVVSGLEDVNIPWSVWFEQGYRAVSFAVEEDTLVELDGELVDTSFIARGHKVDVFHEGFLAESYPEQGKALRVVIINPEAAEEESTDSGRFIGVMVNESVEVIEVKISGVPDEMPSRLYRLTDQAWEVFNTLDLEPEEVVIFRYLEDDQSDGLIFDISRLQN